MPDPNTNPGELKDPITSEITEALNKNVELADWLPNGEDVIIQLGGPIGELQALESLSGRYTASPAEKGFPLFAFVQKTPDGTKRFGLIRHSESTNEDTTFVDVTKTPKQKLPDIKILNANIALDNVDYATIFNNVEKQLEDKMIKDAKEKNQPNHLLMRTQRPTADGKLEYNVMSPLLKDMPLDKTFDILSISKEFKTPAEYLTFMTDLVAKCRTYTKSPLYFNVPAIKDEEFTDGSSKKIFFKFPMTPNGAVLKEQFGEWLKVQLPTSS